MVSHTGSPLFLASMIFCFNSYSHFRDSSNLPTIWFLPTRMQPCVSLTVLPMWMRMPSNIGTPSRSGNHIFFFRQRSLHFQHWRFKCVAKIRFFLSSQKLIINPFDNGKPTDCVGSPFCNACQYQFHKITLKCRNALNGTLGRWDKVTFSANDCGLSVLSIRHVSNA